MTRGKGVIVIGGPSTGTRFRPLSLDVPKPLFRVAGIRMIEEQMRALAKIRDLTEIPLIGYYDAADEGDFVDRLRKKNRARMRYLRESGDEVGSSWCGA
eukprot:EC848965.1.p2 GENE.EC848965.1~~EC848965.1.p2  ORF type:complete len:99 (+),score=30.30 EC848965.1:55-351(+)